MPDVPHLPPDIIDVFEDYVIACIFYVLLVFLCIKI